MSRSYRKPHCTLTPQWDKFSEKRFRRRIKQTLQQFDPDCDWDDLNTSMKGLEEYGTRFGFDVPPDESNEQDMEEMRRMSRK